MDSAFLVLFLLHAVFSGFDCSCTLSALISSKKKAKDFFPGPAFGFKAILVLFLLFKFGNCSAISRVVVVVRVTIVTPHVGPLMIFRIFAYTIGNRNSFLIIYW
jgi:hypothetical protein